MSFKDHFSSQADRYTRFRPRYPAELFAFLASVAPGLGRAWDCGTGSGQAAVALAERFEEVVATDPSRRQVAFAHTHPRVRYAVASAEQCPLADGSVDLVTVAQALHWFDRPRFYAEVRRVGRPGSALAVWAYALATITEEVDRAVWFLYEDVLGQYWPPERKLIEEQYRTIDFPFEPIEAPEFTMSAEWQLADLLGYLDTWSAVVRYRDANAVDPLEVVRERLASAWGAPGRPRRVRWPLLLGVGRIA